MTLAAQSESPLRQLEMFLRRYVILPDEAFLPVAVWVIATYMPSVFDRFGYLDIHSPVKRCGKTRVLELLELLCSKPLNASGCSLAVLFRSMEDCPTLLLDEVESLRNASSEVSQAKREMLNLGFKNGARVGRCTGENFKVTFFSVYGPKAFCSIGGLPGTLADRSIRIPMQRKRPDQKAERFLARTVEPEAAPIREAIDRWSEVNKKAVEAEYLKGGDLESLSDREADIWLPLFAVCSIAGPDRIGELERCAESLSSRKREDDVDEPALELLAYFRDHVWVDGCTWTFTRELVRGLHDDECSPWYEIGLTARAVARLLRTFGIRPRKIRDGQKVLNGYIASDFREAWRYLPEPEQTEQPEQAA